MQKCELRICLQCCAFRLSKLSLSLSQSPALRRKRAPSYVRYVLSYAMAKLVTCFFVFALKKN